MKFIVSFIRSNKSIFPGKHFNFWICGQLKQRKTTWKYRVKVYPSGDQLSRFIRRVCRIKQIYLNLT